MRAAEVDRLDDVTLDDTLTPHHGARETVRTRAPPSTPSSTTLPPYTQRQ